MADHFTTDEWQRINKALDAHPDRYGFPERRDGSVLLGSLYIGKLGDHGSHRRRQGVPIDKRQDA